MDKQRNVKKQKIREREDDKASGTIYKQLVYLGKRLLGDSCTDFATFL